MRNLIKNNYHRHHKKRKAYDVKTIKDLIILYSKLGVSKDETSWNSFHIKNFFEKKLYIHNAKTLPHSPYFTDKLEFKILPRIVSERIYRNNNRNIVIPDNMDYVVRLTKEAYDVLPIKPGIDCKFLGKSVFMPPYKPQTVRGEDPLVSKFRQQIYKTDVVYGKFIEDNVPTRCIVNPGWASQVKEFQIFCDHHKEKYNAEEILKIVSKHLYKLKLPMVREIIPEDCFHVPVNPDSAVGFIPECFFGKGSKQKQLDKVLRFPAYSLLKKAKSELMSDRTIWTVGGRARAQKESFNEDLRSRFLIVPDAISKIVGLAGVSEFYKGIIEINKHYSGNEILTGIDFMNSKFKYFESELRKFDHVIECDLKRFDQHAGREVMKAAWAILRSCYPDNPEMDNLFNYYASGFINKNIVIPGGLLYRVRKSIATGSPFTTVIGSIVNWINWTLSLSEMGIDGKFYKLMVYGDDTLVCFNHHFLYNEDYIKKYRS